ncbi:hypothetical protein BA065_01715 [Nanoarchaeota archaeon NZ13-N]|uniref:Exosortase/archaeosortase family protein n=1 Tax=Candidatus Nanoclepta minutus TaxID=1940235 RepID=A0A397WNH8_9ARCH|nr:MAG: hypothetical protein BA065_01715 [Nanoarchaeota archaeon NZ13-N]RIB35472.1 MAG: hypothetical protein BXU00_01765 [Candidatus Nanoclepta minutus]
MLEVIYKKIIPKDYLDIINSKELYRRLFKLSIFLFNLSIYSIPLLLFHLGLIKIPIEVLSSYTDIIGRLLIMEKEILSNNIVVKSFVFQIDQECMGIKSILGFFAIMMSTPTKEIKRRFLYFLIFSPIVFSLNILRILSTVYGFYFYNLDPGFFHNFLWEVLNVIAIGSLWAVFYIKNKDNTLF